MAADTSHASNHSRTPSSQHAASAVEELRHGQKNVDLEVIVLRIDSRPNSNAPSLPSQLLVADHTASIQLCLFPESRPDLIEPGDILSIRGGYCSLYRKALTLYVGKKGELKRTGRFTKKFSEVPNMSELEFDVLQPEVGVALSVSLKT